MVLILCLTTLMACSHQVVRTEYVKQQIPAVPAEPNYYPVKWGKGTAGTYFVDQMNAKSLLKNMELMKGYQKDLKTILLDLKEAK